MTYVTTSADSDWKEAFPGTDKPVEGVWSVY